MQYEVINKKKKLLCIIFCNGSERVLGFLNIAHPICSSDNAPTDNRELTVKNLFLNDSLKSSCTFLMTNPLIIISINRLLTHIPGTTGRRKNPSGKYQSLIVQMIKSPNSKQCYKRPAVSSDEDGISTYTSKLPTVANAICHDNREFVEVALKLKFHRLS